MLCRVAAVSLLVHHHRLYLISFGIIEPILIILKIEYRFKPALWGGGGGSGGWGGGGGRFGEWEDGRRMQPRKLQCFI